MDAVDNPSLFRAYSKLAIPAAFSFAGQIAFDITDGIWIGRLNEAAIAGQGGASFLTWIAYVIGGSTSALSVDS